MNSSNESSRKQTSSILEEMALSSKYNKKIFTSYYFIISNRFIGKTMRDPNI